MNIFANDHNRALIMPPKHSVAGCKNQFLHGFLHSNALLSEAKVSASRTQPSEGILPANLPANLPSQIAPQIVPNIDYVYVYGHVRADFPSPGLKKEFERYLICTTDDGTVNQFIPGDRQARLKALKMDENLDKLLFEVLSKPENRYIARLMSWTLFDSYGNDVYQLKPTESQLNALIAAIEPRQAADNGDAQAHTGVQASTAQKHRKVMLLGSVSESADSLNLLPELSIRKIESASPASILEVLKSQSTEVKEQPLKQIVANILSLSDNDGDNEKERALNYILFHNLAIYTRSYAIIYEDGSETPVARLSHVQVQTEVSGERRIGKVVFEFQNTSGGAGQSWYCAVDVTDQNPFLLVDFRPYLPLYG